MSNIHRTVAVVAVVAAVLSAPLAATPKSTRRLAPTAPVPTTAAGTLASRWPQLAALTGLERTLPPTPALTVDSGPIIDPDGSPTPAPTVDGGPLIDPDGAR